MSQEPMQYFNILLVFSSELYCAMAGELVALRDLNQYYGSVHSQDSTL